MSGITHSYIWFTTISSKFSLHFAFRVTLFIISWSQNLPQFCIWFMVPMAFSVVEMPKYSLPYTCCPININLYRSRNEKSTYKNKSSVLSFMDTKQSKEIIWKLLFKRTVHQIKTSASLYLCFLLWMHIKSTIVDQFRLFLQLHSSRAVIYLTHHLVPPCLDES